MQNRVADQFAGRTTAASEKQPSGFSLPSSTEKIVTQAGEFIAKNPAACLAAAVAAGVILGFLIKRR
jgi:ElaB/YqjD/DUF883 family membrane-anchored ribosome-binding protein